MKSWEKFFFVQLKQQKSNKSNKKNSKFPVVVIKDCESEIKKKKSLELNWKWYLLSTKNVLVCVMWASICGNNSLYCRSFYFSMLLLLYSSTAIFCVCFYWVVLYTWIHISNRNTKSENEWKTNNFPKFAI